MLIQRHIDRVKDTSPDSHRRAFDGFFGKLKTALWEMREDQNEESIKHALSPSKPKNSNAAKVGEEKGSELPKATPAPKVKAKSPPKGEGKGKSGKGDQPKGLPPSVPCLFYPKGTCNCGSECPFAHVEPRHQPRRRQSRPRLPLQRRQPLPLFWPAVQARLSELQHHLHQPLAEVIAFAATLFGETQHIQETLEYLFEQDIPVMLEQDEAVIKIIKTNIQQSCDIAIASAR